MSPDSPSIYAPFFTEEERRHLEGIPHDDLTGEIHLLRYLLALVMSKSHPDPQDLELLLQPPI
jgi:hypothetical protein